jgi:uncharacterized protein (DUF1684 family)/heat shock protein HslJ
MTFRVQALLALAVLSSACARGSPEPIPIDPGEHARRVEAFAAAREAELAAPGSWLSLVGLHFLEPGETTVGSAPDNGIVLPAPAAPRLGTLVVEEAGVRWRTEAGVTVTQGVDSTLAAEPGTGAVPSGPSEDPAVEEADLTPGAEVGKSVVLRFGSLSWLVIRRGGRWALRVRDDASPAYQSFHGIERFPTSLDWRVTARWEPHEKTVAVPDVLGNVTQQPSPAALRFRVQGRDLALDVVGEPENGRTMLVFADATSGSETYGGGRFLWVDGPDEQGRVVVDFNLAFNPPCVWTEYATCPLPTRDNRLPVRVEAGEKSPKHAPQPSAARSPDTADAVGTLEGMMTYLSGVAAFTECRSGIAYPIAREREYAALERAYLADRRAPEAPLFVRVQGWIARRPDTVSGEVAAVVVESVEGIEPEAGCGERESDLPLEGTEWMLSQLGGAPVTEGVRATLLLDGTERRASGSGACNTFSGPYRLEGASLTFGNLATTLRSCPGPVAAVEAAYFRALGGVGGYRLMGASLELLSGEGTALRFLAR